MNHCPTFEELSELADGQTEPNSEGVLRRHLGDCPACLARLESMRALKRSVARAYDERDAPPAIIRPHAARPTRSVRWRLAAAAAILLAAAGTVLFSSRGAEPLETFARSIVAEHERTADASALEIDTDDPAHLSAWFTGRFARSVAVRALPDARLLGGRVTSVLGHPVAVARYERHGVPMSLFYTDAEGSLDDDVIRRTFDAVSVPECRHVSAYRVCLHRSGYLLVGIVAHRSARPEDALPQNDRAEAL